MTAVDPETTISVEAEVTSTSVAEETSTTCSTTCTESTATATATESATPPFATADPNSRETGYLPCIPGTFLCTSATEWLTCDYNGNTVTGFTSQDLVWKNSRTVAPGTECLPSLSLYTALNNGYTQQSNSPDGSYRDDRYVRSSALGRCTTHGDIRCVSEGKAFEVCDNGGWVSMGSVAPGTSCVDGEIVPA
jgi:hypothetical protein